MFSSILVASPSQSHPLLVLGVAPRVALEMVVGATAQSIGGTWWCPYCTWSCAANGAGHSTVCVALASTLYDTCSCVELEGVAIEIAPEVSLRVMFAVTLGVVAGVALGMTL